MSNPQNQPVHIFESGGGQNRSLQIETKLDGDGDAVIWISYGDDYIPLYFDNDQRLEMARVLESLKKP